MKLTALAIIDARTSDATLARLQAAYRRQVVPPGQMAEVSIAHDEDCPAIVGPAPGMACTCTPDLIIQTPDGRRWVDRGQGWEAEPA
jgi:hypothetical protein